jgi:hypothetical protein
VGRRNKKSVHDLGSETLEIDVGFPGLDVSRDSIRRQAYGSYKARTVLQ